MKGSKEDSGFVAYLRSLLFIAYISNMFKYMWPSKSVCLLTTSEHSFGTVKNFICVLKYFLYLCLITISNL